MFQALNENNYQPLPIYLAKLTFKIDGRKKKDIFIQNSIALNLFPANQHCKKKSRNT